MISECLPSVGARPLLARVHGIGISSKFTGKMMKERQDYSSQEAALLDFYSQVSDHKYQATLYSGADHFSVWATYGRGCGEFTYKTFRKAWKKISRYTCFN
jgi:hypothetical protein